MAASTKPERRSLPLARSAPEDLIGSNVDRAKSNDLVCAVTGYVGAGATLVTTALAERLQAVGYTPKLIK